MSRAARSLLWVLAPLVAVLGAGAAPAAAGTPSDTVAASPASVLAHLTEEVGGRGADAEHERYAYLQKLDSHLQDVAASRLGDGTPAAADAAADRQGVTTAPDGAALTDVYVQPGSDVAAAAFALRALGMQVTGTDDRAPQRMVEGYLPPAALTAAAALASTKALLTPYSVVSTGSVESQGDTASHGPAARAFGPNGTGIEIGVISDSINQASGGIAASQASGNLPASVVALSDSPGGTDEGRAMAEIAYDEAPGIAGILFATANGGTVAKANAIDGLVSHGAKVIADDTSYVTEPFFQDDVVAQAVDRAKAAGVAYFVAAGNDGQQSWEGTYNGGTSEDFDPGPAVDTIQTVGTLPPSSSATIVLQWAEPWGRASTDLALDVYKIVGATPTLIGTVNSNNIATGVPEEATSLTNSSSTTPLTYAVAIRRVGGTSSPLMKFTAFTDGVGTVAIEHPTNSDTISPDAASANGAMTVAAARYSIPTTPEAFSARGPVTHYFDASGNVLAAPEVRAKPNLAAPDGVSTSMTAFTPFFGTSAATPAAAGIAALILSAKPLMSIDELYSIMTNTANSLDCTATAGQPDNDCGSGFVLADRALAMALDPSPPVVTATVAPSAPEGADGWYHVPVTVTWSATDAQSPISVATGCLTTSPPDGTTTLTCTVTSAGGTTTVPVVIKRDSVPPTTPVISGLAARSYEPATVPAKAKLKCATTDQFSGVAGCAITGYGTSLGRHKLTATAVDEAGLTSTATLGYTVVKPPAISRLKLAEGITLARLVRAGAPITVRVATPSTRLAISLAARVGKRTIALARMVKKVHEGTVGLRVTLTKHAREQLAAVERATLRITVTGTSSRSKRTSLHGSRISR